MTHSHNLALICYFRISQRTKIRWSLKANVSQEILSWHSLRHNHSADIFIHFYCLLMSEASKPKKNDSKISTMTMPKTMPVQNLLRYISF